MKLARFEKEAILYTGFVAQEVEKVANEIGYDFSGIKKPAIDKSHYSLSYAEFVVPLVKALQEQQNLIELLQVQNQEMKQELELLKELINNEY